MNIKSYLIFIAAFFSFISADANEDNDTTFIYFKDGKVVAFPNEYVVSQQNQDGFYVISLYDDVSFQYDEESIDHIDNSRPLDMPYMKTFKINNKYNHHVYFDVDGNIDEERLVTLTVPTIGKYLKPSFTLSENGIAYVNGQQQISKETKLKFDGDVVYTVANPLYSIWNGSKMVPYGLDYTIRIGWPAYEADDVPRIDIYTDTGDLPQDKVTYINSYIVFDGKGILPSMEDSVLIRGRGNSSWNAHNPYDKNPYRLKFANKVKPFGLKKGKSWVLLANKQTGSMTTNAIGMKIAELVGTAYPNHIIPVELYINGGYRGSYNFTEKIGFSGNSIDLDDETEATLLEMDTRKDAHYFWAKPDNFPVNIKEPDFDDAAVVTTLTKAYIRDHFNNWCGKLSRREPISEDVDIDNLARFLFVNDIIRNTEVDYAKSCFLYRENKTSKYIFGPVWDFDWGFGYVTNKRYFMDKAEDALFAPITTETTLRAKNFMYCARYDNDVSELYKDIMRSFVTDTLELYDFIDDYLNYIKPSIVHNATKWKDKTDYDLLTQNAKQWLTKRIHYVQTEIEGYLEEDEYTMGDVNNDGIVTIYDVMLVINHIVGVKLLASPEILRADYNNDSVVSITDLMYLVNQMVGETE